MPVFDLKWKHEVDYFFFMTSPHVAPSSKVAAFDLDWTIVKPTSGQFAKSRMDWEWMFDGVVKTRLQQLNKEGYKIIFFTNQAGIEKNRTQVEDVQWKIVDLCKELGFPIQACICGNFLSFLSSHLLTKAPKTTGESPARTCGIS